MSQSPPNYIDGLPVKISEKYKPPPKISLPQKIVQCLANRGHTTTTPVYDFHLERNVLGKISEWNNMRQHERCERRERIRQRQIERQKQIEERQKQLLTAVSYPSTEDLSSSEEEQEVEEESHTQQRTNDTESNFNQQEQEQQQQPRQPLQQYTNHFDTILVPTVIPGTDLHNLNNQMVCPYNQNFNKINYSDFENDTSSPFDNVEMKTMNDLDILAQVLNLNTSPSSSTSTPSTSGGGGVHSNQDITISITTITTTVTTAITTTPAQPFHPHHPHQLNNSGATVEETNIINENVTTVTFTTLQQQPMQQMLHSDNLGNLNDFGTVVHPHHQQQMQLHHQQQQPQPLNYYNPHLVNQTNFNPYASNFNQYDENYYNYNGQTGAASTGNVINGDIYSHQQTMPSHQQQQQQPTFYYNYNNQSNHNYAQSYGYNNGSQGGGRATEQFQRPYEQHIYEQTSASPVEVTPVTQKLKSKSVPDILKELNDELKDSEMKRTRNNSQSISSPVDDNDDTASQLKPTEDSFRKMSISSQKLIKNISSMGFPLDRVSRIAEKLGKDDKKIVEHLIPLSELLDLGFDENKISDALIQFDNNKDKALDFLIS